jgi:starch synthase
MPKYGFIDTFKYNFQVTDIVLVVPMGFWEEYARLWVGKLPHSNVPVYLIEHNIYFDRNGIYGDPNEYIDNDRRFIFFSRAIFEAAKALNFSPDIIHAHDYHAAFTMAFLKTFYRHDPMFSGTAGVYTIHNLAYQGRFNPENAMLYSGFGMSQFYPGSWFEHFGSINAMKTGIMFADKITTVSPTYAKEIRYPYYSEALQDELNKRGGDLIGVLNGVYYDEWNPETDDDIYIKYSENELNLKKDNKYKFLEEAGILNEDNLDLPLIGMVSRLTEQKGIELVIQKLEYYLENNLFRFVLLGSGESKYVDYFHYLSWKYPKNAIINIGYNNELSHKIFACSDFLLVPSRFEPCGLTQMYAMKFGTIPIVRMTGGLADTVSEYLQDTGEGWGFLFWQYNADDMAYAIRRALSIYEVNPHWEFIRKNAMSRNFSSSKTSLEYLKVFKWALEKVRT